MVIYELICENVCDGVFHFGYFKTKKGAYNSMKKALFDNHYNYMNYYSKRFRRSITNGFTPKCYIIESELQE